MSRISRLPSPAAVQPALDEFAELGRVALLVWCKVRLPQTRAGCSLVARGCWESLSCIGGI